jgi:putative chitinase
MDLTADDIATCTGATVQRAQDWLPHLQEACGIFAIDTPERLSAFLAQLGHESGRLRYVREIWGPIPVQLRYEGREDLGNTQPGDGKRYMGRGLIQTTGRANYRATSAGLGEFIPDVPDFEAEPEALERPRWAALSAAWYWHSHGLNALADAGDFVRITRRINGGTNGMEDRQALYNAAREALA